MMVDLKKVSCVISVLSLLLLSGCCSNRRNISMEISESFWDDKVYVDVACIKNNEYAQYNTCSEEGYWEDDNDLRSDLNSETFIFDLNHPAKQKLLKDNPMWDDWEKSGYLLVLVNMPKAYEGVSWKMIMPLKIGCFGNDDIFLYISEKGLVRLDKELEHTDSPHISEDNMRRFNENMK